MRLRQLSLPALAMAAALLPVVVIAPSSSASRVSTVGAAVADTAAPDEVVPVIEWSPCFADPEPVQCATVEVPLDYDDPFGPTTQVALARIPAADQENKIGSLFLNPGGPGGSGVGLVKGGFGPFLAERLEGRFDIVGFDPRGIAESDPLKCFANNEESSQFGADQPFFPYLPGQYASYFANGAELAARCTAPEPSRIGANMNTANVARDMDLLRRAVGDDKINYLGFSYGSYLGTTYAALFPDNVRALVIDGVLDPLLWSSGYQIVSDRDATDRVFEELLRLCDEAAESCAFASEEGSRARWDATVSAVRATPIPLDDGSFFTYDLLIGEGVSATYAPEVWPDFALFADAVADAALGDPVAAAAVRGLRQQLHERLGAKEPGEEFYDNSVEAYHGNQCSDTQYPTTLREFRAIDRYASLGTQFGTFWWWQNAPCASWPVNEDRYTGPWNVTTSSPVLVVGNFFDNATDYEGAQAANRYLGGSRLLSYAGWGHTAYGRNDCTTDFVDSYLLDGTLPPEGIVCAANPNPFTPSTSRTSVVTADPMVGLPPSWMLNS